MPTITNGMDNRSYEQTIISSTPHGVLIGEGSSPIVSTAVGATGQVLSGVTGGDPVWAEAAVGSNSYHTDSGSATPSGGVINISGQHNINTSGAGSTVSVQNNNTSTWGDLSVVAAGSPSVTLTSGDLTISGTGVGAGGNLNMPETSSADIGVIEWNGERFIHRFGTANNFLGSHAGNFTLSGIENTGLGYSALTALTTGSYNTAVGVDALDDTAGGTHNIGLGAHAFNDATTGVNNTVIGTFAGGQGAWNGSYNTVINSACRAPGIGQILYNGTESSNILINNAGVLAENNTIHIGTTGVGSGQQSKCYIAGVDGVNVGSVAKVLTMASEQVGTATITAGAGILVTPGANTITIAASGAGFTWSVITTTPQAVSIENGYIANRGAGVAFSLPAVAAVGDVFRITNINAGGWSLTQAAGQSVRIGSSITTVGVGGSLASTALGDSIEVVCTVANTTFQVLSSMGNITVV